MESNYARFAFESEFTRRSRVVGGALVRFPNRMRTSRKSKARRSTGETVSRGPHAPSTMASCALGTVWSQKELFSESQLATFRRACNLTVRRRPSKSEIKTKIESVPEQGTLPALT
jgi:hypothetical protein